MTPLLLAQIVLTLVRLRHALLSSAAAMVCVERTVAALLQQRLGPTRVGWQGLLQPFADVIKLMFKEELRPRAADPLLVRAGADHLRDAPPSPPSPSCRSAPSTTLVRPARRAAAAAGRRRQRRGAGDLRDRVDGRLRHRARRLELEQQMHSLLGGLRSSAQMISYELSYGLALASVLLDRQLAVADRHW
mgnify:CR=1 FL=1